MEERLADTRESLIRIEEKLTALLVANEKDHTEFREVQKDNCAKITALERDRLSRIVSWKTLCKMGATGVGTVTLCLTIYEFAKTIFGW